MELNKAIKNRRSIREYKTKLVTDESIDELVDSFSLAPTSCNLQLASLVLVNDKETLVLMKKHVTGKVDWTNQLFVLVVNNTINYGNSAQEISAGMAVQNLMLKAEELGIGTCPIAGFSGKSYLKKLLNVPVEFDIPLLIFFGYKKELPKNHLIVPYRADKQIILSKNKFNNFYFKSTNNLNKWTLDEILEYRKRIFSVYYPRFRHGLWRNSLNDEFKTFLINSINGDCLCYYFWESGFLNQLNDNIDLYVYDDFDEYTNFLKSKYDINISKKFDKSKKFDNIFLANTLEFCKNREDVFKDISLKLSTSGSAKLLFFNYWGIFAIFFRTLNLIGLTNSVYEKSPFYKIGPYGFIKYSEVKTYLKENNLEIVEKKFIRTNCLGDKFNNKIIRYLISMTNIIFPENIKLKIKLK